MFRCGWYAMQLAVVWTSAGGKSSYFFNLSIYSVISLCLMWLRRPTLVWFVVVSGYGGLRGFCGFFGLSIIYLVMGYLLDSNRWDRSEHGHLSRWHHMVANHHSAIQHFTHSDTMSWLIIIPFVDVDHCCHCGQLVDCCYFLLLFAVAAINITCVPTTLLSTTSTTWIIWPYLHQLHLAKLTATP